MCTHAHTHTHTHLAWTEREGAETNHPRGVWGAGWTAGGGCARGGWEQRAEGSRGGSPAEPTAGRPGPELHDTALGLVRVGVLEPQSLLRPVFFQVGELFAVDGSAPLPGQTGPGWGSGRTQARPPALPQSCRPQRREGLEWVPVTHRALPPLGLCPGCSFHQNHSHCSHRCCPSGHLAIAPPG